mgnify:CR=1 FL=1
MPEPDISVDPLILEWEQQATRYEVVACIERWSRLPAELHRHIEQAVKRSIDPRQQLLFLSFDGLMERRYNAFLLTQTGRAVLYYEDAGDLTNDYIGTLSPEDLWAFLESFPNVYRHLSENP